MWGWVARILGYFTTAVAVPYASAKWGAEVGAAVGTVGGLILHKTSTTLLPTPSYNPKALPDWFPKEKK